MKSKRYSTILLSVLGQTNNTVFEIAPDYTFIEAYTANKEDLLLPREQFIGKKIEEVVPVAVWSKLAVYFIQAAERQEEIRFTYPSFFAEDDRWFSASLRYIAEGCEYPFFLLCVMDITARRKAEEKSRFHAAFEEQMIFVTSILLQATEETFDESVNDVLMRIGTFAMADRAYLFRFNTNRTAMSNTHEWCAPGVNPEINNLQELPVDIFPRWMEQLQRNEEVYIPDVQELPENWSGEKAILEPQGIESLIALPVSVSGNLYGFIGFDAVGKKIRWDNSQRQLLQLLAANIGSVILRHQQNLHLRQISAHAQELAEKANRANRYKSDFLANMSHEMRTPLHAVLGFTDVLLRTETNPVQQQYLGHLKEAADSLLKVVNQILDFSKIESGKMGVEMEKTELPVLLERCCNKVRQSAASKGLSFRYQPENSIPDFCIVDDLKLEQVLNNLLGNAVKFTSSGAVELKVEKQATNTEANLVTLLFSVCDTGIGISSEQQNRIFHAFSQADNSISRKYGGTGLGLSISRKLLDLMGADLQLRSSVGKGSTFYFELDVQPVFN